MCLHVCAFSVVYIREYNYVSFDEEPIHTVSKKARLNFKILMFKIFLSH